MGFGTKWTVKPLVVLQNTQKFKGTPRVLIPTQPIMMFCNKCCTIVYTHVLYVENFGMGSVSEALQK